MKEKVTKNELTRQLISRSLYEEAKRELTGVLLALSSLSAFTLITLLIVFASVDFSAINSTSAELLVIGAFAVFLVGFIIFLVHKQSTRLKMIKNGEFSIVEDKMQEMVKSEYISGPDTPWYLRRRRRMVNYVSVLYFENYGRYILKAGDGDVFLYSQESDIFYLVVLNNNPKVPVAVYNTRIYRLTNNT